MTVKECQSNENFLTISRYIESGSLVNLNKKAEGLWHDRTAETAVLSYSVKCTPKGYGTSDLPVYQAKHT